MRPICDQPFRHVAESLRGRDFHWLLGLLVHELPRHYIAASWNHKSEACLLTKGCSAVALGQSEPGVCQYLVIEPPSICAEIDAGRDESRK